MLFVLIALIWLAIVAFFVIICRIAAGDDASSMPAPERLPSLADEAVVRRISPSSSSRPSEHAEGSARPYAAAGTHRQHARTAALAVHSERG
jgi:hypothetical protein